MQVDAIRNDIRSILLSRPRLSTSGFPYLHSALWARLRDWVPLILDDAALVMQITAELEEEIGESCKENARVIRQVVRTTAITAPSDLWLMRHIQSAFVKVGFAKRFLDGEAILAADCGFIEKEIEIDFRFLLSRGTLVRQGEAYRLADHDAARDFMSLPSLDLVDVFTIWVDAFDSLSDEQTQHLARAMQSFGTTSKEPGFWHPSALQIELASQLVPLVVALKWGEKIDAILNEGFKQVFADASANDFAREVLQYCGVLDEKYQVSEIGKRVLGRGPGPFGIIETYRQYLEKLETIWSRGRKEVWVERSANVAASQTANRKSFVRAHDALAEFCEDQGFRFSTFIEHAVGKGEAIRQCRNRYGDDLNFVGADLEDKAIDAAEKERKLGELPSTTQFVRKADIGKPASLLKGLEKIGVPSQGAVMMVGNGFHEVRGKSDAQMIEVFRGYEAAGILLIFTEESALSIDDLIETAFNTYHAGFRYVHERSGQALRPGIAAARSVFEEKLPMSWAECAVEAGYLRLEKYCRSSRKVYPYTPISGFNPIISAEHFLVPRKIAEECGLVETTPTLASFIPKNWLKVLEGHGKFDAALVNLDSFLANERERYSVYPPQEKIFAALTFCAFEDVKVVILGQDPYHGKGQANGLAFSVGEGIKIPPSLRNIYKELHSDLGCEIPEHGGLEGWAEQGVLLLNTSLTVQEKKAASHAKKGWKEVSDRIVEVLSEREDPCVFILWGAHSKKKAKRIAGHHTLIQSAHPSPLSAHNGFWDSKPFSKTNSALKKMGKDEIDWTLV